MSLIDWRVLVALDIWLLMLVLYLINEYKRNLKTNNI